MADTTISSGNAVQRWERQFFREFVRNNRFNRYSGTNMNAIIHHNERLMGQKGNIVSIPLVTRLNGAGVSGNNTLEGAEEALNNYNHDINTTTYRNAYLLTNEENQKTEMDLLNEAKPMTMTWAMEDLRDRTIAAMLSPNVDGVTTYAAASEANKDAWVLANRDRILFGALLSNLEADSDHSDSIVKLTNTDDSLDAGIVSLAKRMAKTADPHIRPWRVAGREDEEWYVMFAQPLAFRDLKADTVISAANREAWSRYNGAIGPASGNPIFTDGDLIYDGVIIREVPEIAVISGVGAAGIDVAPNFLCGAQAVGVGWAKRPMAIQETRDYKFRHGRGVEFNYGVEKLTYNDIQHGMVTVYTAGVGDS